MKISVLLAVIALFASALMAQDIPDGYIKQSLASVGGELLMPKSWYFEAGSDSSGKQAILLATKEKPVNGDYDTGLKIVMIPEAHLAGAPAEMQALASLEHFETDAVRVLRKFERQKVGELSRQGVEVLERNERNPKDDYHVIYSFFWSDKNDMVVMSCFGAPQSQWPEAYRIYNVMGKFTLGASSNSNQNGPALKGGATKH